MMSKDKTSVLNRLSDWYARQCHGDWHHYYGVHIETCDNPGWIVRIDLTGTSLAHQKFSTIREGDFSANCPSPPWIDCRVEKEVFVGAGDISRLEEILNIFLSWCNSC